MLLSLHKQATTTPKIRAAIQASMEPAWRVAERYGISVHLAQVLRSAGAGSTLGPSTGGKSPPLLSDQSTFLIRIFKVFTKNRDRLLTTELSRKFLAATLAHREVAPLLSDEDFSVDGTLVKAWASMKSFQPKVAEAAAIRLDLGDTSRMQRAKAA